MKCMITHDGLRNWRACNYVQNLTNKMFEHCKILFLTIPQDAVDYVFRGTMLAYHLDIGNITVFEMTRQLTPEILENYDIVYLDCTSDIYSLMRGVVSCGFAELCHQYDGVCMGGFEGADIISSTFTDGLHLIPNTVITSARGVEYESGFVDPGQTIWLNENQAAVYCDGVCRVVTL